MNKEYVRALSIAENALKEIDRINDNAEGEEFEDAMICMAMENISVDLSSFIAEVKHFSKGTKEGYLRINSNDRYSIINNELSCGCPLEVYNAEFQKWEAGRVEHSSKYGGYYFYNYDGRHTPLFDGMKARIRA